MRVYFSTEESEQPALISGRRLCVWKDARGDKIENSTEPILDSLQQKSLVGIRRHFGTALAFSMSVIEKRKPLGPTARRAGWVGCNILLGRIPADARVPIITRGQVVKPADARKQYASLRPLEHFTVENRGWTLDVLNELRALGKADFTLSEVYVREASLSRIYPHNHHVREKIRQQLQVLRDLGLVNFLGSGRYRLLPSARNK